VSKQNPQKAHWSYQDWLATYHETYSDPQTALESYRQLFQVSPSLERYKKLQELAKQAQATWEPLRKDISKSFEQQKQWPMLIEISLYEQDIERALELVSKYPSGNYKAKVAQATEQTKPEAAIALYQQLVGQAIAGRSRPTYQTAAQYLKRIQPLFAATNAQDEWQVYLRKIRSEYVRLPALQDELNKAGLPK
jgi:uncharacterized Zn finger protein